MKVIISTVLVGLFPACRLCVPAERVPDPTGPDPGTDPGPAGEISKPGETEDQPGGGGRGDGGGSSCGIKLQTLPHAAT